MYVDVLPACSGSVHHVHAWCLWTAEEDARSPRTAVIKGCELPLGGWELNPGPLKEQLVLLTILFSTLPNPF